MSQEVKSEIRNCIRRYHDGGLDEARRMFGRRRLKMWKQVSGSQLMNPVVWLQVTNRIHMTMVRRLDIL